MWFALWFASIVGYHVVIVLCSWLALVAKSFLGAKDIPETDAQNLTLSYAWVREPKSSRAQVALVVCWLLTCNMLWKCVQAMFVSQFLPSRFFVGGEFVALRRLCCHIYRDIVI